MKKINKIIIFAVLFATMFFVGCDFNSTSTESQIICVGDAIQLEAPYADVTWSSSDESVVLVSNEGIAKGVGQGLATVYAKTSEKTLTTTIKVYDENNMPTVIVEGRQTLKVQESVTLISSVINYENECNYIYSTNDSKVASVDDKGEVTGISSGLATITVKAYDDTTLVSSKEILFYIYEVSEDGNIINNYVDNKTYEITGSIDITSLNEKVVDVVDKYSGSIIGVSNYQYVSVNPYASKTLVEASVGTGFIFKKEVQGNTNLYYVLTNYHVIDGNSQVKVYFGDTGDYSDASVLAGNESLDLAVITFTSKDVFTVLEFGAVDDLSVGDFAIAIGNANGYDYYGSVTFGIISYINRAVKGETATFLQHDVAINPGNSGGPLLDINGKVIGVNTLKLVEDEIDNVGFAISIEVVKDFLKSVSIAI